MPAATSKAEIIAITEKEWDRLANLLDKLEPELACMLGEDGTSIKDVIAHRAHWIDLFLGWYADGQAGHEVHIPAEGYKWNRLKAYNAALRTRQSGLDWDEVCVLLATAHAKLLAFYDVHSDADLYSGPMKGANNAWTPGRWSESAGASHFRSAAKFVRARVKAAGP